MEFYISQTKADNHAVREAACACIAELGTKVSLFTLKLPYNCQEVNTLARENTFSKFEFIFLVVDDDVIKFKFILSTYRDFEIQRRGRQGERQKNNRFN